MKRISCVIFFVSLFTSIPFYAQLSEGGIPYSIIENKKNIIPAVVMEAIPIEKIKKEDEESKFDNVPWRFAWPFKVQINMNSHGIWTNNTDGSRLWQLRILCPNAQSINFLYDDFYIPEGGKFYLYAADQSQIIGAYTSKNNRPSRKFGTELVFDDEVILEYYEPKNQVEEASISIAQISHGYRSELWAQDLNRDLGDSGACQVNVNCSPEGDNWQEYKTSVAKIVVNGNEWCTGSLMNNTSNDGTPYFLTADHCNAGLDAVTNPDASTWVFYWNYEYAGCANTGSVPTQTTSGGTMVANDDASDFALLLLAENPATNFGVIYNGFNATNTVGVGGVGIHHPSGDAKKIATHTIAPGTLNGIGGGLSGDYWNISWSATSNGHSVTEGGSSGSPLYDANSRVCGQLFGGSAINCSDPANDPGWYGKLSYSWFNNGATIAQRRLHDWLNPGGSGAVTEWGPLGLACSGSVVLNGTLNGDYFSGGTIDTDGNVPNGNNVQLFAPGITTLGLGFEVFPGGGLNIAFGDCSTLAPNEDQTEDSINENDQNSNQNQN